MRIVCCADTHFGHSDHLGKINPETGLHTRLEDFLANFDRILDYVMNPLNGVELLIIAGDLYKTRHPTNTQQEEFAKRLRKLQDGGVDTLILMGNHDIVVSEGASHTAGVLKALVNECIRVFDHPGIFKKKDASIALIPYIYRQKLGVRTNEEALVFYKDNVMKLLKKMLGECGNERLIFVGHQSIEGAKMPSGVLDPEKVSEIIVPQSYMKGFDFAVFGHIHEYQIVNTKPTTIYTGPIDRIDFSQADKPVGFIVYDTVTNEHEFIELPAADLYKVQVDLTDGQGNLTERVLKAIDMSRVANSILKIEYKIRETDLVRLNKNALQEVLNGARFPAGMIANIERSRTSRNQEVDETIAAQDALKKYIEGREDLHDIANEMLKRGLDIIKLCDLNRS